MPSPAFYNRDDPLVRLRVYTTQFLLTGSFYLKSFYNIFEASFDFSEHEKRDAKIFIPNPKSVFHKWKFVIINPCCRFTAANDLWGYGIYVINSVDNTKLPCSAHSHRRSTTVSLGTYYFYSFMGIDFKSVIMKLWSETKKRLIISANLCWSLFILRISKDREYERKKK